MAYAGKVFIVLIALLFTGCLLGGEEETDSNQTNVTLNLSSYSLQGYGEAGNTWKIEYTDGHVDNSSSWTFAQDGSGTISFDGETHVITKGNYLLGYYFKSLDRTIRFGALGVLMQPQAIANNGVWAQENLSTDNAIKIKISAKFSLKGSPYVSLGGSAYDSVIVQNLNIKLFDNSTNALISEISETYYMVKTFGTIASFDKSMILVREMKSAVINGKKVF